MRSRERTFEILGLSELEEELYRFVVEAPGRPADETARALGRDATAVEATAVALEQKGFITRAADPPTLLPIPPSRAVDEPLRARSQELEAAKHAAMRLTDRWRAAASGSHPAQVVEMIAGAGAVKEAWYSLLQTLEHETLVLSKPPRLPAYGMPPAIEIANTRSRTIYDRTVLVDEPERIRWMLQHAADDGSDARLGGDLPLRMFIADHRAAVIPVVGSTNEIEGGLLIWESDLLDSLVAFFELLWSQATPLIQGSASMAPHVQATGDLSDPERQILGLMAAGLTDRGIARALGVSLSTVERRMRAIMSRFGVTSRYQLGYTVADRRASVVPQTDVLTTADDG